MKEITLPVSELKQALPGLSKIVGRRSSLPVLQTIRIARDADGKVSIQASDLDSCATYSFKEAQSGPAVELLVPLEQLVKTAKGLKSEGTIGLVPDGKEKVKLRYSIGGNMVEQNVTTLPVAEFPPTPKVNQPSCSLEAGFGLAVRQALESCSDDPSRYILKGACLDVTDKNFHYVVGTNGRHLFSANSFSFDLKKSVVIPDSKFMEWTDFLDEEPASLSFEPGEEAQEAKGKQPAKEATAGWVKLESGCWTFITKEIEGKYPNWKQVIPETNAKWTRVQLSDEAVRQLILVTPNLPGDSLANRTVRLSITADRVLIEGQGTEDEGWTSIPIQGVEVKGKPVTIALNREYVLRALKFGLNQFEVEDSLTAVVFSKGGKKMVIMPVNITGPVTTTPAPQSTASAEVPSTTTATPPTSTTPPAANNEEAAGSPTQERKEESMAKTAKTTTPETAEVQFNSNANSSAVTSLVDHVEQIKDALKGVIRDLSSIADAVKQAEKERKASDKEIDAIRSKLRQIQNVTI